jgi:hypothetical protein
MDRLLSRGRILILSVSVLILSGIVYALWPNIIVATSLEQSPLAWLQSSLLVACASATGLRALFDASPKPSRDDRAQQAWLILSLLLIVAALDERFMFHERVQELLFYDFLNGNPKLKHWTQMLTVAYTFAGIGAYFWLRRALVWQAWRWCRAGIALGLLAISIDIVVDSLTVQVIEELLEAMAETLLLCSLFTEVGTLASRRN